VGNRGELSHAERRKFRRYLAVFKRIGMIVQDELMTIETVDAPYGERFAMLLSRERIRQLVDGTEYSAPCSRRPCLADWRARRRPPEDVRRGARCGSP
jgi:hypothetical protein